ncbi:carboxypeptidase Taq [Enhydrobacter aerosaccus]|uniref:Metal-dependent carboxypeptidase n=1 Tax=Enhydrobacter aerosaccus TaxID=225324 RepID=A0A1T4JNX2_9HYPH|nr:carboxypeptidase M32 [Enhydrobacter aerosaccus]SJZ31902.1 carboxypeptidase Taq [Enhydrobacter aerosaccus]
MNPSAAYAELERRFHRLSAVNRAGAILNWDRSTMMPDGASDDRADQLATLNVVAHEILTAPDMPELMSRAEEGKGGLDSWQAANLREMRHVWTHANALPADLVEARTRAASACEMAWREAKKQANFKILLPTLEKVVEITKRVGAAKAQALGLPFYDALLDEYEPGGRSARIDALFGELKAFLPDLLQRVLARQHAAGQLLELDGPFPVEAQRKLGEQMIRVIGFDFHHGRLDVSAHPFTGGTADDVRITTRYDEHDFARALMGVLHECGHALYELGLPRDWNRQPVGNARGMVLHESQSLLMEMQACRSRSFIAFAAPRMREAFGKRGPAWETDNIHRLYTRVMPGFIRVDADEVTYPLHIMLRYRLERAILEGDLPLAELPGAWNDGMRELLGIVPPNDAMGCLQDIHWPDASWGYFPTYTLGALAAAQLFAAARAAEPGLMDEIAQGNFRPLLTWLRTNVHGKGSLADTDRILIEATGQPLGTQAFKAHLESRYLSA